MATRPKSITTKPAFEVVPVADRPKILAEIAELADLGETATDWFCLLRRGRLQRTPGGNPVVHPSRPLLDAIGVELSNSDATCIMHHAITLMFGTMLDVVLPEFETLGSCQKSILTDPTLQLGDGPESHRQADLLGPVHWDFGQRGLLLVNFPKGKPAKEQLAWFEKHHKDLKPDLNKVVASFDARFTALSPAQRCVVKYAGEKHQVFVPGVLLAESACSVDEYVDLVIAAHCKIAGVFDISQDDENMERARIRNAATAMARFRDLADAPLAVN